MRRAQTQTKPVHSFCESYLYTTYFHFMIIAWYELHVHVAFRPWIVWRHSLLTIETVKVDVTVKREEGVEEDREREDYICITA